MQPIRFGKSHISRQRGLITVWVALGLITFVMMAGLSIDVGAWYQRAAEAQMTADAAALAGASQLASGQTDSSATTTATNYATYNGYLVQSVAAHVAGHPAWFRITVTRKEHTYFSGWYSTHQKWVNATATAISRSQVPIPPNPKIYGIGQGTYNYSQFGKYALHSNGDKYSVVYLNSGANNPDYRPNGYVYQLTVPTTYAANNGTSHVQIELYDPDCYNSGTNDIDEIRSPNSTGNHFIGNAGTENRTISNYILEYSSNQGQTWNTVTGDDGHAATATFGTESATNLQWVTPQGFTFDSANYPNSLFRIRVETPDGSSENGFNLRAGPPHTVNLKNASNQAYLSNTVSYTDNNGNTVTKTSQSYGLSQMSEATWHSTLSGFDVNGNATGVNGAMISALGRDPLNVNVSTTVDLYLGKIPASAAGGDFTITRFDTDVGWGGLYYWCEQYGQTNHFPKDANGNAVTLASTGDDGELTDTIQLPADYNGAMWHASYIIGATDTSSWELNYTGGQNGAVSLVGQPGLSF